MSSGLSQTVLQAFYYEIERQCRFVLMAAHDLETGLNSKDMDRLWYSVQALLVAAANISKLLWPPRPHIRNRGDQLRNNLSVRADSSLELRTFRDHFEHYDERLEDWASSSARHNIVDTSVLSSGAITGIDARDFMRNFDPTSYSITFRGDSHPLKPIVEEVAGLWTRVTIEINRLFRYHGTNP